MPLSLPRIPFSRLFRQLEQDVETVVKVLQPGPLGIVDHKFTGDEIKRANLTVNRAIDNWQRVACVEQKSHFLKEFIHSKR